jgi:hypothetical protein
MGWSVRPSGRVVAEVSGWSLRAPWRMVRGLVATVLGTSQRVRRRASPRPLRRSPRTSRRAPARPLQAVSRYLSTSPRTTPPRGRPRPRRGPPPASRELSTRPQIRASSACRQGLSGTLARPLDALHQHPPRSRRRSPQHGRPAPCRDRLREPRGTLGALRHTLPRGPSDVSGEQSGEPCHHPSRESRSAFDQPCDDFSGGPPRPLGEASAAPLRGVSDAACATRRRSSQRPSTSRATKPQRGPARGRRRPAETRPATRPTTLLHRRADRCREAIARPRASARRSCHHASWRPVRIPGAWVRCSPVGTDAG